MITLRIASIVDETISEGPGNRMAIWVQGCSIRCPSCCNPEMFDQRKGTEHLLDDLFAKITQVKNERKIEGISILGGEPFDQITGVTMLAEHAKANGLTVMAFSGYYLSELRARHDTERMLSLADILVDGRYDASMPEPKPPIGRRWIGSTNQTMHYLTDAYSKEEPQMRDDNTIEIRFNKSGLQINGWPSAQQLANIRPRRKSD